MFRSELKQRQCSVWIKAFISDRNVHHLISVRRFCVISLGIDKVLIPTLLTKKDEEKNINLKLNAIFMHTKALSENLNTLPFTSWCSSSPFLHARPGYLKGFDKDYYHETRTPVLTDSSKTIIHLALSLSWRIVNPNTRPPIKTHPHGLLKK